MTVTTPVKAPPGASRTRYLILGLAFVGLSLNYLDRANLSVALPFIEDDLHLELSNAEKGLILGAFFWAYDGGDARSRPVHLIVTDAAESWLL